MQPTSPLRDSIRPEAELLLGWMRRLDGVMGNLLPTGGTVTVDGHAQPSVTESYFLARRTFGSTVLLMDWTARTTDTDRTEDAAVLVRKSLELLARCAFVVGPASTDDRLDQDLRAARAELVDIRQHLVALREAVALGDRPELSDRVTEWEQTAEDLAGWVMSESGELPNAHVSLDDEGTPRCKPPPDVHSTLRAVSPMHALMWRQLSDVIHGGTMGRAFQRSDLTIGVPAEPSRQDMVMHSAIAVMAAICSQWLEIMSCRSRVFDEFAVEFGQLNSESIEQRPGPPQTG